MNETITNKDNKGSKGNNNGDKVVFGADSDSMDRFVKVFEASARRWELVIYPTMLAFVILAAYGFFLIYSLSRDIHSLAQGMDPEMGKNLRNISDSVAYLSENVRTMTRRVDKMTNHIEDISGHMIALETMSPMLTHIRGMDVAMQNMTVSMDTMRGEITYMGRNIARPMDKMNQFMPW